MERETNEMKKHTLTALIAGLMALMLMITACGGEEATGEPQTEDDNQQQRQQQQSPQATEPPAATTPVQLTRAATATPTPEPTATRPWPTPILTRTPESTARPANPTPTAMAQPTAVPTTETEKETVNRGETLQLPVYVGEEPLIHVFVEEAWHRFDIEDGYKVPVKGITSSGRTVRINDPENWDISFELFQVPGINLGYTPETVIVGNDGTIQVKDAAVEGRDVRLVMRHGGGNVIRLLQVHPTREIKRIEWLAEADYEECRITVGSMTYERRALLVATTAGEATEQSKKTLEKMGMRQNAWATGTNVEGLEMSSSIVEMPEGYCPTDEELDHMVKELRRVPGTIETWFIKEWDVEWWEEHHGLELPLNRP